jgi:L-lactate dehydrogenase complex protein LldG
MSSRNAILAAVRQNRPPDVPLPPPVEPAGPAGDLVPEFVRLVEAIGGVVVDTTPAEVEERLRARYPDAVRVASAAPAFVRGSVELAATADPHHLADVDLMVCEAVIGVAENGAVWLPESRLGNRAAPFIAQHLAVVLDRAHLVPDMHHAYARIRSDEDGYGVFVAGPSKTADIEQSLVIGAHGPRSLTVLLI